ncbi:hypothetical protein [Stenotrophomonas phage vB_SmaS_BUCT548]|uniref:Endonuclease n=1 Tax=Stenotrophomonas phage vB_SmaS_BUCT548 TaxID=2712941 RepID=A0A7D2HHU6_9CAUD|nr:RusA-like Holliday junction resolvase [Stenotrophomonas phage vB_SmaS_BUCT548]QIQ60831.1 hypothetical protein [Stenotrophomonas phage vB_SmaS_BUCT548]
MKRINIRQKGANGEREVATWMNEIVERVCIEEGVPVPVKPIIQRNQNQSAVGGSDLTNPFGYAIEVKRQETLSVNTWWNQSCVAAKEFGGTPVVIYRQNGKRSWHVVMYTFVPVWGSEGYIQARAEISQEDFMKHFEATVRFYIRSDKWRPEAG